jgi:uncharacterized protein YecT (DUF1311 family)
MRNADLLAALILCLASPALAVDKATMLAEFGEFVSSCNEPGGMHDTVDECIEDQVGALDGHLGDIVTEMTGYVNKAAATAMVKGQKAFEQYRQLTCASEGEAHPEEKYAGLFCYFRLTSQRVSDVREGLSFSTLAP